MKIIPDCALRGKHLWIPDSSPWEAFFFDEGGNKNHFAFDMGEDSPLVKCVSVILTIPLPIFH